MPVPAPRSNVRVAPGNAPWARREPPSSPFASPPPKSLPRNVMVVKGAAAPTPDAPTEKPAVDPSGPFIRLRTLLVLGLIAGAAWLLQPRAKAAWQLHSTATNLANYALCMVGPTGPALLRDNSPEFAALLRRRLLSAEASDRPFQDCAKLAAELTGRAAAERAHRAPAWSFVEYGGTGPSDVSLAELGVEGHHLADLARSAWPFVRGGYVKLVKPSIAAREAVHPIDTPKPGAGRGLPAWRAGYRAVGEVDGVLTAAFGKAASLSVYQSTDGGLSWRSAPARGTEAFAERCPAGPRSFTFSLSTDAAKLLVSSQGPDAPPQATELGPADVELVSASCDQKALVVAYVGDADKQVHLAACAFRGRCTPMPLPRFAGVGVAPGPALDLARVDGTTIVSVPMAGIVRVASSRDDGVTWTPFTVAYDDRAHAEPRVDVRVPSRLLAVGKRVFLFGAAPKPGQSYSVIVSDDFGASWRSPDASPTPVAVK
ncbi:MAG: hypothetical protein IPM35_30970 [Myxococcales bacterium]|nr:hypothetical protein [Myxococcales bacterium]